MRLKRRGLAPTVTNPDVHKGECVLLCSRWMATWGDLASELGLGKDLRENAQIISVWSSQKSPGLRTGTGTVTFPLCMCRAACSRQAWLPLALCSHGGTDAALSPEPRSDSSELSASALLDPRKGIQGREFATADPPLESHDGIFPSGPHRSAIFGSRERWLHSRALRPR